MQDISQTSANDWSRQTNARAYRLEKTETRVLPVKYQQRSSLHYYEKEMHQAALNHEVGIAEIRKTFVMQDELAVNSFLNEHRRIPQLLLQAFPHLRGCFGPHTVFALRVPIEESGFRDLYAIAKWPGSVQNAIEALDKFEALWWIDNSRQAAGNLSFTYELV